MPCGGQLKNPPGGRRLALLLPYDPLQVLGSQIQQLFELADPVLADIARPVGCTGFVKQPDGFLVIGLRHVQGVFEGGVVPES